MKPTFLALLALIFLSCETTKEPVDLLLINGNIYTVNEAFDQIEALAIKDGLIVATGSSSDMLQYFTATDTLDLEGKAVYPGLIDAHAHLFNLGVSKQQVELMGTTSYQEVLDRTVAFQEEYQVPFILGRGWDQNDWEVQEFPTKKELDELFPDTPVALTRVDGHAMIANSRALEMAGITAQTKMAGGEVLVENGAPTGLLVDTPMGLVRGIIPEMGWEQVDRALMEAQEECVSLGLTTIVDAGLQKEIIYRIDSLQQQQMLKLRVYAMVANNPNNLDHFLSNPPIKTDRLNVRSVKVYADGALGSRGAALKQSYSDKPHHFGAMITNEENLRALALRIANAGFQMNTHAIGDSANIAVIRAYNNALDGLEDARWKIEHAQVVAPEDFVHFSKNIIPSVQPTHATSDMYWAEDRVGPDRIKGAYSYKTLLDQAGLVALGTDFPVEKVNPMHTFYAAVARKDLQHWPEDGFRPEEKLSREEALKGMTIWAAYSNFEDHEKGSVEIGKFADLVVLDTDIMQCEEDRIPDTKVLYNFIGGELVYTATDSN